MAKSKTTEKKKAPQKRIENLTPEQEAMIPVYEKKGIEWGMCCAPINEDAAYDFAKRLMAWLERRYGGCVIVDSPYEANRVAHMLAVREYMEEQAEKRERQRREEAGLPGEPISLAQGTMLMLDECSPAPSQSAQAELRRKVHALTVETAKKTGLRGKKLHAFVREAALGGAAQIAVA